MDNINPLQCPICQENNACAAEIARVNGTKAERCWCFDAVFSPAVMALVPAPALGKACICAKCTTSVS